MGVEITPNLTLIDDCDANTLWDSDENIVVDTEYYVEGTASIGAILNEDKAPQSSYNYLENTPGTNLDLTNQHIFFSFSTAQVPFLSDYSGIRFELDDGGSKGTWNLDDGDTYGGGWKSYVMDTNRPFDNGSCTISNVDLLIWRLHLAAQSAKAATNTWVDSIWYGDGITVKGGTSSTPGTFSQLNDSSQSTDTRYGVMEKYGGVYYLQSRFYFGDSVSAYFEDEGQTIVFIDNYTSSNLYEIIVSGAGAVFQLGTKAGTAGVGGCTINQEELDRSQGYWAFNAATYEISACRLYGSTFINSSDFSLPKDSGGKEASEVLNCSFIECGTIIVSSCTFENNSIISCDDVGIRMDSNHAVKDCDFINCPSGIIFYHSGLNVTLDNLQFINCTKDIVNASTGWVSANCTNDCNASSYVNTNGGTTKIRNVVNVDVYVIDTDSNLISGAYVGVYSGAIASGISICSDFPTSTNQAAGLARGVYNYSDWSNDIPIEIYIRKSSDTHHIRYFPVKTTGTVESDGFSVTSTLTRDTIVDPDI